MSNDDRFSAVRVVMRGLDAWFAEKFPEVVERLQEDPDMDRADLAQHATNEHNNEE